MALNASSEDESDGNPTVDTRGLDDLYEVIRLMGVIKSGMSENLSVYQNQYAEIEQGKGTLDYDEEYLKQFESFLDSFATRTANMSNMEEECGRNSRRSWNLKNILNNNIATLKEAQMKRTEAFLEFSENKDLFKKSLAEWESLKTAFEKEVGVCASSFQTKAELCPVLPPLEVGSDDSLEIVEPIPVGEQPIHSGADHQPQDSHKSEPPKGEAKTTQSSMPSGAVHQDNQTPEKPWVDCLPPVARKIAKTLPEEVLQAAQTRAETAFPNKTDDYLDVEGVLKGVPHRDIESIEDFEDSELYDARWTTFDKGMKQLQSSRSNAEMQRVKNFHESYDFHINEWFYQGYNPGLGLAQGDILLAMAQLGGALSALQQVGILDMDSVFFILWRVSIKVKELEIGGRNFNLSELLPVIHTERCPLYTDKVLVQLYRAGREVASSFRDEHLLLKISSNTEYVAASEDEMNEGNSNGEKATDEQHVVPGVMNDMDTDPDWDELYTPPDVSGLSNSHDTRSKMNW